MASRRGGNELKGIWMDIEHVGERAGGIDERYGIWKFQNHHPVDEKSVTGLKPLASKHIHEGQGRILLWVRMAMRMNIGLLTLFLVGHSIVLKS